MKTDFRALTRFCAIAILFFCSTICSPLMTHAGQAESSLSSSTELSGLYKEGAGEILIKAHQYDKNAIILTTIGYWHGIGGFPKNYFLASWWNTQLLTVDDIPSMSLITLAMREKEEADHHELGIRLAMCAPALRSALLSTFNDAGLFDAIAYCGNLETQKSLISEWEHSYTDTREAIMESEAMQKTVMASVRNFRDQPCAETTTGKLYAAYDEAVPGSIPFYAATTHNTGTETPDWSPERLLQFLEKLNTCPLTENEKSSRAKGVLLTQNMTLIQDVRDALTSIMFPETQQVLSVISKAHNFFDFHDQEAIDAIHAMSQYYRAGMFGFLKSDLLANLWLQYGALGFDNKSRLILAINTYAEERYSDAWAWASIIENDRDADADMKAMATRLRLAVETHVGGDIIRHGKASESLFLLLSKVWLDWLEKQRVINMKQDEAE